MKLIIACRHGEAFKNLKNIYGGKGSGLTDNGREQVNELARKLMGVQKEFKLPIDIYRSCDRVQIIETSEIIKEALKLGEVKTDKSFCPIRLGVFDGMSREKQLELYPEACAAHEKWEKGEIDVTESEKLVEGMQPALDYYNQVKNFINSLKENQIYILVGTRSDLSCLKNVIHNQSPEIPMQYKCNKSGYCEIVAGLVMDNGEIKSIDTNELIQNGNNPSEFGK